MFSGGKIVDHHLIRAVPVTCLGVDELLHKLDVFVFCFGFPFSEMNPEVFY